MVGIFIWTCTENPTKREISPFYKEKYVYNEKQIKFLPCYSHAPVSTVIFIINLRIKIYFAISFVHLHSSVENTINLCKLWKAESFRLFPFVFLNLLSVKRDSKTQNFPLFWIFRSFAAIFFGFFLTRPSFLYGNLKRCVMISWNVFLQFGSLFGSWLYLEILLKSIEEFLLRRNSSQRGNIEKWTSTNQNCIVCELITFN